MYVQTHKCKRRPQILIEYLQARLDYVMEFFLYVAGKIFANCDRSSSDVSSNVSSFCFTIDYVTDRVVAADSAVESCGDPYVSPDSRHLVIVKDNRKSLDVYRIYDDGRFQRYFARYMVADSGTW